MSSTGKGKSSKTKDASNVKDKTSPNGKTKTGVTKGSSKNEAVKEKAITAAQMKRFNEVLSKNGTTLTDMKELVVQMHKENKEKAQKKAEKEMAKAGAF